MTNRKRITISLDRNMEKMLEKHKADIGSATLSGACEDLMRIGLETFEKLQAQSSKAELDDIIERVKEVERLLRESTG